MIQPNELRVGNWLINSDLQTETKLTQVKGVLLDRVLNEYRYPHPYDTGTSTNEILTRFEKLKPVPLTAEILAKCGFKPNDSEMPDNCHEYRSWMDYHNDQVCIDHYYNGVDGRDDKFVFEWEGGDFDVKTEIQNLHQLQNLYYALTGEELEVGI